MSEATVDIDMPPVFDNDDVVLLNDIHIEGNRVDKTGKGKAR